MAPERQRLARLLLEEYLEMYAARDMRLVDRFSQDFSGFAGSSDQLVKAREAWVRMVLSDFAQVPGRIGIHLVDVFFQDLSLDVLVATAFFHIQLPTPDPIFARETARLVLVFRQEGADWKIAHSSISIPYGMPRGLDGFPAEGPPTPQRELQVLLDERTRALAEARRQLDVLSHTDQLTGLANRRRFEQVLAREWERAQRAQTALSLVLLDVDAFKAFNESYGRLAGDACLQALALVLSQLVERQGTDLAARHGGDEFAVLMPGLDGQAALAAARHIQEAIAGLALRHLGTPSGALTASLGLASLVPGRDQTPDELLRRADLGLRRARQAGYNGIELAPEAPGE
nr:diguanylate cyclase [uncultured Acidovorax sp.]